MSSFVNVTYNEIIAQIKFSCQIPFVIKDVLTRKIIVSVAQEVGIKVEPNELQQAADHLRLINNLHSASATWSWLKTHNLSLNDFEALIYETVLSSKLSEHLFANQVEPFFVEHQLDYAQVIMYEVVLNDEDLAMELFYALKQGEMSFPEVAHQYIQNTELRRCGGYKGMQSYKALKPEISAAVFAVTPPQILKPIITSEGVKLIFVEEIVQPELDEKLYSTIVSDLFSDWLMRRIEEFEVALLQA